ncbi:hypothetical protein AB0I61_17310 [Polymorphospora rubra]|uniref:hypothetical protein n=1 Tax=Polymorphospora rubra TaxID=338584 RepID=UPI0033FD0243
MKLRNLARHQNLALRLAGVSEADLNSGHQWNGWAAPAFPHNNDGGTGNGSGSGGGGGSGGEGGDGDGDDDGDGKPLSEMTDAEKAKFWQRQARANERKLKGAPKPEELEKLRADAAEMEKIRDGQRSDAEKATARADKAEARVAELEPKLLRLEVALEKGLTAKQAARLVGSTKEELEADADDLLEEIGAVKAKGEEEKKATRSAARKESGRDAGVRGSREDTKGSVQSGADLYASRRPKKTTTAG